MRDEATLSAREPEAELAALFNDLQAAPFAHDFFALLRRIESLRRDAPRIGHARRPSQEALRLGQEPELDFAPAALATFTASASSAPRLGVRFFGLLGSQGPMPLHFTEHVRERLRYRGDPTAARFLDIFHHRLLTLFYRAWADAQPTVQHDRPAEDRFKAWLGAGFGLTADAPASDDHSSLPEAAQLYAAGLLGARSRHAEGLAELLSNFFKVPVRIEPYIAHWLMIDPADRSQLAHARNRPERSRQPGASLGAALGVDANAGSKVRDVRSKFRIVIGPLNYAQYLGFLPGGAAWPQLCGAVHQYAGLDMRWDLQLGLAWHANPAHTQVPEPRLGRRVPLGVAAWLGGAKAPAPERGGLHIRPATSFLLRRQGASHA